jgi:hypothetical protein
LALALGCGRHKRETERNNAGGGTGNTNRQADWFILVHYGGKLALAENPSTASMTNLIRPNALSGFVPKGSNRVAVIEVPSERILNDDKDEIWSTAEAVLKELSGLGFQRATVEAHRWGQTHIITNVTFR